MNKIKMLCGALLVWTSIHILLFAMLLSQWLNSNMYYTFTFAMLLVLVGIYVAIPITIYLSRSK